MVEPGTNPEWKRAEASGSDAAVSLGGCLVLLVPLLWIGSCVISGPDEPDMVPTNAASLVAAPAKNPVMGNKEQRGSSMLEQAILDAFPVKPPEGKKARRIANNAADFVGAAINSAGYLCASPIEAQQVAIGQYGISCRKYRYGRARSNFIIDVRTGTVSEI